MLRAFVDSGVVCLYIPKGVVCWDCPGILRFLLSMWFFILVFSYLMLVNVFFSCHQFKDCVIVFVYLFGNSRFVSDYWPKDGSAGLDCGGNLTLLRPRR